jgi:hypothetical protein
MNNQAVLFFSLSLFLGACGATEGVAQDGSGTGGTAPGGASTGGGDLGGSTGTGAQPGTGAAGSGGTGSGGVADGSGGISGGAGGTAGNGGLGGVNGGGGATHDEVCEGTAPVPMGYPICETSADCPSGGDLCTTGPSLQTCGACHPPFDECATDADCSESTTNTVCVPTEPDPCSCGGGTGMTCAPTCGNDSCRGDETCESDGHCRPTSCEAGYHCPEGSICDPKQPDAHGCSPASCETDGFTCPSGSTCDPGVDADEHDCRVQNCDTEGVPCGDDEICDPQNAVGKSGCRPTTCDEGYQCPLNERCNPASESYRHCEGLTCNRDTDCDCGVCANGVCFNRPLICVPPPPA